MVTIEKIVENLPRNYFVYDEYWSDPRWYRPEWLDRYKSATKDDSLDTVWIKLDDLAYGDYFGDAMNRSNYEVFLEKFSNSKYVRDVHGSYGFHAVLIKADLCSADMMDDSHESEILEILQQLVNYSCIDEEHLSNLELQLQDEAWKECYARDFYKGIMNIYNENAATIKDIELSENELRRFFEQVRNRENIYWEIEEGCNAYVDVNRILKSVTVNDINKALKGEDIE